MSELLVDPLTGLMTPFYFYESAKRLQSWADRKGQQLSIIAVRAVDLSDEQLAKCARDLSDELRGGDLLCRMGERTFALLLVGDYKSAGHLIFRLENVLKPRLDYSAVELKAGESITIGLGLLGI
jgi:GGDEF domain-containing protein